jgi:hypothetical protein
MAVLSKMPAVVTDIERGYVQRVDIHSLTFLHFHCTPGTEPAVRAAREHLIQARRNLISSLPVAPILVGDFNCVVHQFDVQVGPQPFNFAKMSPVLRSIIADFLYIDVFRQLYPNILQFSFFRPNCLASRLDRVYVPHLFINSCFLARYIPTASDHNAFYTVFDAASLGLRLEPQTKSNSFYWKLNSSMLSEPAFEQAFQTFWAGLLPSKDGFLGGPAAWWEQAAKPAVRAFCRSFSKAVAARNLHTRRFFTRALELALQNSDWPAVEACRHRLINFDKQVAAGMAVRAHVPLLPGEEPSIYLLAKEGQYGRSPGLEAVKTVNGDVLREPEAVEAEVLAYFEALFQGRHVVTEEDPEPYDSGMPFSPTAPSAPFLNGLPTLSPAQRHDLDQPFTLHELKSAVASVAASKAPGLDGISYEFYSATFPLTGPPPPRGPKCYAS